jgi:hypothetical protein
MNRIESTNIVVFSSLSFVKLKVDDDFYEIHEIIIHTFLNMPDITSPGAVGFTRIAKSEEYDIEYQPIETDKKYVASLVSDPRGLLYTVYDDSSPIMEASTENIEKFKQYIEFYDTLSLGLKST